MFKNRSSRGRHEPHGDRRHLQHRHRDARPVRRVGGTWVERGGRAGRCSQAPVWSWRIRRRRAGRGTEQLWWYTSDTASMGGIGLGIGYISRSHHSSVFPDRPGLANGPGYGLGGGALIRLATVGELLSATPQAGDAIVPGLPDLGGPLPDHDVVGAFTVRVPADDWKPEGWTPPTARRPRRCRRRDVTASSAIRTPQFWRLWTVLFCNVTAGIGIPRAGLAR